MKILIAIVFGLFSSLIHASLLVEPQVGYVFSSKFSGTMTYSGPANGTSNIDESSTGIAYGGRLGYSNFGFMGGLNYGKFSGKSKDNTDGSKDNIDASNLGVFIGYNAPVLLRGWLAYNLMSKAKVDTSDFEGKSTEIGLGFKGFPLISLNLIYRMYDFTKLESSGMNFTVSNFKPKEIEFALSMPFNFL